jgi:hypothetical protein
LVEKEPASRPYQSLLALGYEHLGIVHPDRREAARALARSLEIREALLARYPQKAAGYRSQLAYNYYNAAVDDLGRRDPEEALRWSAMARTIREQQAQGQAGVDVREHLAQIYLVTGALQRRLGRAEEAIDSCRKGIEVYARLAAANPDEGRFPVGLADAYLELSFSQDRAGKHKEGVASLEQACAVLEDLVAREFPLGTNLFPFQRSLAQAYYNLSLSYGQHYPASAQPDRLLQKTSELCAKLLAVRPSDPELLYWHGISCVNLATRKVFFPDTQFRLCEQARGSLERLARLRPTDLDNRRALSEVVHRLGTQLANRGQHQEAAALMGQSVEHQRAAYLGGGKSAADRDVLAQRCRYLATVRRDLKRPGEAAEATLEWAALYRENPAALYQAACDLARCAALTAAGKTSLPPDREDEYRRLAGLALDQLRAAVAAGYRDAGRLRTDPSLGLLRGREEFQALVRAAEAQGKVKGGKERGND